MTHSITQIQDDIYQVALPLPFALKIINAYLIRGDQGWTIIDSGLNTSRARQVWEEAFDALGISNTAVQQIILTHCHPDHYGLAGWLQKRFSTENGYVPPVKLSAKENDIAQRVWHDLDDWGRVSTEFWHKCGIDDATATAVTNSAFETGARTFPHPTKTEIISAGTIIQIGNRSCHIFEMAGHSEGQLLFYDKQNGILFCGDHVLNKITPNISCWPYSHDDPLGAYLESFKTIEQLNVTVALPGHGPVIPHINERMAQIAQHHAERLALTQAAVSSPKTVQEVSDALFNQDKLTMHEVRFAVTETLAHLEYLQIRGTLKRLGTKVWKYQPV